MDNNKILCDVIERMVKRTNISRVSKISFRIEGFNVNDAITEANKFGWNFHGFNQEDGHKYIVFTNKSNKPKGKSFKQLEEGKLYKHIGYANYYTKKEGLLFRVDYNKYADFSNSDFILGMRFVEMIEKED